MMACMMSPRAGSDDEKWRAVASVKLIALRKWKKVSRSATKTVTHR